MVVAAAQEDAADRLTRTGFFVGTLQYVAPEALSGELVREPADIYSLANITYYLLTARHPFRGRSPRELFQQLLVAEPVPLSESSETPVPPPLERAVMTGLSRDPAKRQPTVRALADEVSLAISSTPSWSSPPPRRTRRTG